ncbi:MULTISPECIES: class I SAM-dependent methyltransferase [Streptacidiphilus]|uniref:Class I SAM-dependent methyltransferase n=2 Tax=Streptacidiphilus TaxID=228398 RepID=A0ABV6USE7_9ACTN|nr:class I SAM-dependent methyltransferase [Streptacidiphilus jeojiense]
MPSQTAQPKAPRPERLDDIPGWFFANDRVLFDWFLGDFQREVHGDLLELGVYLGKSAVLLGHYLHPDEKLTVCDLFDSEVADDEANGAEVADFYQSTLSRVRFEQNYLAFHDTLPEIIQAPTSALADGRVPAGSCRFVHVDASHLYEHVVGDIQVAREVLLPDGVVVLDDYRTEHTPGVAAAVWQAVLDHGLHPICVSPQKFYGTWGDPEPARTALRSALAQWPDRGSADHSLAGEDFIQMWGKGEPPAFPLSRFHGEAQAAARTGEQRGDAARAPQSSARLKRLAADWLPPVVTRAVVRRRRRSG